MAQITIKIKNLKKLRAALNRYPAISGKHISAAMNKAVFAIEAKAIPLTPVRTGRLRGSFSFGRILSTPRTLQARVKPDVNYAGFIHFGTRASGGRFVPALGKRLINPAHPSFGTHPGIKANPFLKKGFERAEAQINRFFGEALENITIELTK